jgi:MoxR-like ATPase
VHETSTKSCLNCPSYLNVREAANLQGRPVGTPMCARFAKPLALPGMSSADEDFVAEKIAETCSDYGNSRPASPTQFNTEIAFPHLELKDRATSIRDTGSKVGYRPPTSCNQCMFFVPAVNVQRQLGYNTGMCKVQGRLILNRRERTEAKNCPWSVTGANQVDVRDMNLYPVYMGKANPVIIEERKAEREKFYIEPSEYETDAPVSEADARAGVRAWRRINDPEGGGRYVDLPIYDAVKLGLADEERAKIPRTGSKEHPESYVDHNGAVYKIAVLWMGLDQVPALWGEAGVGKTEIFRHFAWLMQLPFERFSITASTELDDLAGKSHYSPEKGTYFTYGRMTKAWARPCVAVVDEPNVGQNDVWQFMRPMFDNSKQLVLDTNMNETVERGAAGFWGLAMNPAWNPLNVGTNVIGDADASRLFHVSMELPPADEEKRIIAARVKMEDDWEIPASKLDTLMRIAADIRAQCRETTLQISWGIRTQIQVARALRWFDFPTAYLIVKGNYLEPDQRQILLDQVKNHT